LFVAEFSRECTGDEKFCKEINVASGDTLIVMSRQYLDTRTLTGPDKDDIAPHRVLIFDKKQK
jgi:hypothetical protein